MKSPALCRFPGSGLVALLLAAVLAGCGSGNPKRSASELTPLDRTTLDDYEHIRAALAADDSQEAHHAAVILAGKLKDVDAKDVAATWREPIQGIAAERSIDRMRQRFKALSDLVIPTVRGVDGFYIMTCDLPAAGDWVQRTPEVDDPYLGRAMHSMGELKK